MQPGQAGSPGRPVPGGVRPAAPVAYRRVSVRKYLRMPQAGGRHAPCRPANKSYFPAVPCRLLYHLPQQRRDAAAHGHDIIRRRTRVRHSRVPACRSGGCPAVHVSGLQQTPAPGRSPAARPIFRAAGLPRTRHARAVYAARRQGGGVAPLPFCTAA